MGKREDVGEIPEGLICLTVDVEWASKLVLDDLVGHLNERGLRATFFCTHPGIEVAGHERAIHPNFRRTGDAVRELYAAGDEGGRDLADKAIYEYVVRKTRAFCPEAVGVRAHSLFYDSDLLPIYRGAGIEYDSSYILPLAYGIRPVWEANDILEIPIYYMDHWDLIVGATGFRADRLGLDGPGVKVLAFHPNMLFINAADDAQYLESKPNYHDVEALARIRNGGRGVRTIFLEILDVIADRKLSTATLGEVNAACRAQRAQELNEERGRAIWK